MMRNKNYFLNGLLYGLVVLFIIISLDRKEYNLTGFLITALGWLINGEFNRRQNEWQFVMDKKFKAYELSQNYLTEYAKGLYEAWGEIQGLLLTLRNERLREYKSDWKFVLLGISKRWLEVNSAWNSFHKNFEIYRIALIEIDDLFYKYLDKHRELDQLFSEKTLLNTEDYSNVIDDEVQRKNLENLFNELLEKLNQQIAFNLDIVTAFQNRLFSKVFKNSVSPRKPQDPKMEVLT